MSHKPDTLTAIHIRCGNALFSLVVASDASGNIERPSGSSLRGAGTYPYISPEQQNPNRKKILDAKTDIYSLGIILFELHHPRVVDEDEKNEVRLYQLG